MRSVAFAVSTAVLGLLLPQQARAQQPLEIQCPAIKNCSATIETGEGVQTQDIVVEVRSGGTPVVGAHVRFTTTSGKLLPYVTLTDAQGQARTAWFRQGGSDAVAVVVHARKDRWSATKVVDLKTKQEGKPQQLILFKEGGFDQSWFEKASLRRSVGVRIAAARDIRIGADTIARRDTADIADPSVCGAQRVIFARSGGSATVSPDTAKGVVYERKGSKACYAYTYWVLGEGVGNRWLNLYAIPGKGFRHDSLVLEAHARAHAQPRFITGFTQSWTKGYIGLKPGATKTVHYEVTEGGVKRSFDSTETKASEVGEIGGAAHFGVVAGVSTPIPFGRMSWMPHDLWQVLDRVSVTMGVDLAHPTEHLYLGASALRLLGLRMEALPVDLHAVAHFGARDELLDVEKCKQSLGCATKKRTRYQGMAVMVSADATSLVESLIKKLVP